MKKKTPVTSAIRALRTAGVSFEEHLYKYEERGGTQVSSRELDVPEHKVIKTLVFEDDKKQAFIVLMHGDQKVSSKNLARSIRARSAVPCKPEVAEQHTGYKVGGTSPFGLRKKLPVYAQDSIRDLDTVLINGGARGYLVELRPQDLQSILNPIWLSVAQEL